MAFMSLANKVYASGAYSLDGEMFGVLDVIE